MAIYPPHLLISAPIDPFSNFNILDETKYFRLDVALVHHHIVFTTSAKHHSNLFRRNVERPT